MLKALIFITVRSCGTSDRWKYVHLYFLYVSKLGTSSMFVTE